MATPPLFLIHSPTSVPPLCGSCESALKAPTHQSDTNIPYKYKNSVFNLFCDWFMEYAESAFFIFSTARHLQYDRHLSTAEIGLVCKDLKAQTALKWQCYTLDRPAKDVTPADLQLNTHSSITWLTYPSDLSSSLSNFTRRYWHPGGCILARLSNWIVWSCMGFVETKTLCEEGASRLLLAPPPESLGSLKCGLVLDTHQTGCLEKARPPVFAWGDRTAAAEEGVCLCVLLWPGSKVTTNRETHHDKALTKDILLTKLNQST